ncbi:nucleotidyltransferase family protein [Rhodovulum sulfidophilum]|uniref:nucleotidyltransferase family protein n=1 Tax=Rhodovulum sulfidophilum TaxID=35806 RepID=UPI0021166FD1|nr:NTP transferase domain-containing protein [Rhodovulum sulfidophilum]
MKTDILILVPAAGASSRMHGRDKLLECVGGEALLRRQVRAAGASGTQVLVLVTLPRHAAGPRSEQLDALPRLKVAYVDPAEGMAASLRAGAAAARVAGARGLMVLLPDMPDIETGDVVRMIEAFAKAPDRCLRATTEDGRPGHPVLFPARLFPALEAVAGDTGGRDMLAAETVCPVILPGERAVTDLDTPDAWAAWRARSGH